MSEYWKSTPKYWCKHCKTYVRDTKVDKTNHDATPKHQGNLKRFLRDLHKGHERDEKDKERAKNEVARLKGTFGAGGGGSGGESSSTGFGRGPTPSVPKQHATPAQRRQQLAQLAELGVSVPDEFRPDMAMAGEWEVTEQRIIDPTEEKKPQAIGIGVRKREEIGEHEEEDAVERKKRRFGGVKTYPEAGDDDLDALLSQSTPKKEMAKEDSEPAVKKEVVGDDVSDIDRTIPSVKSEPGHVENSLGDIKGIGGLADVTTEGQERGSAPLFKKRKPKQIRQK